MRTEWRHCDRHPDIDPDRHWGCADCMAEARRELRNAEAELEQLRAKAARYQAVLEKIAAGGYTGATFMAQRALSSPAASEGGKE